MTKWTSGQKVMVKHDSVDGLWYLASVCGIGEQGFTVEYPGWEGTDDHTEFLEWASERVCGAKGGRKVWEYKSLGGWKRRETDGAVQPEKSKRVTKPPSLDKEKVFPAKTSFKAQQKANKLPTTHQEMKSSPKVSKAKKAPLQTHSSTKNVAQNESVNQKKSAGTKRELEASKPTLNVAIERCQIALNKLEAAELPEEGQLQDLIQDDIISLQRLADRMLKYSLITGLENNRNKRQRQR